MTVTSHNSELGDKTYFAYGAADNTSSQILLSRGVAGMAGLSHSSSTLTQPSFTVSNERDNVRVINKAEDSEMSRGRAVQRVSKYPDPLSKAESRLRSQKNTAIEVDLRPIRRHESSRASPLHHLNSSDGPLDLRDCSSEYVMKNHTTISKGQMHIEPPPRNRVTKSREGNLRPAFTVPSPSLNSVLWPDRNPEFAGHDLHASTFNPGSLASPNEESTSIPSAARLPTEILQQIFCLMNPADFNSARRICRIWFIGSLEPSILRMMLRRGGWSTSIRHDLESNQSQAKEYKLNDAWTMSKRIARECALGPDWTGNGLSENDDRDAASRRSGFVHNSTIDFGEVPVPQSEASAPGIIFTASTCGKFLMAANGCVIYIYELNGGYEYTDNAAACPGMLRPVTSIVCPRRVLACSMDTSSLRYAIAVLLDERVGLVCDIDPNQICTTTASKHCNEDSEDHLRAESLGDKTSQGQQYSSEPSYNLVPTHSAHEPRFVFRGIATAVTSAPMGYDSHNAARAHSLATLGVIAGALPGAQFPIRAAGATRQTNVVQSPSKQQHTFTTAMPIETGPRSVYKNLCSEDDPPRSVAICPQRHCVAFGCSAGIELHWVDALTGQDLNRWFPLTSPSDYLFFLPPRAGIDSAKKLRLISSAAGPGERAAIGHRLSGGATTNSPFWDNFATGEEARQSDAQASRDVRLISRLRAHSRRTALTGRIDCSDHYRAIPLDDGYHVLFTDPATGLLCLGSDGPIGGPTKLLRKIWFQGPAGASGPVAYAGCMDADSGVRVVAAFGSSSEQRIWFFSVPGDVFAANKGLPFVLGGSYSQAWSQGAGTYNRNANWVDWWPDQGLQEWLNSVRDCIPGALPRTIWPVKIRGQEIGVCPAIVDLTVYSGSSIRVWAFSGGGVAKSWRIYDGNNTAVKNAWIARDGAVHEVDRDSEPNARLPHFNSLSVRSLSFTQKSFDGTSSTDMLHHFGRYSPEHKPIIQAAPRSDRDPASSETILTHEYDLGPQEAIDAVAYLYNREGRLYRSSHRSGYSYESIGSDFAEGLTGITRIEVEIR